MALKIFEKVVEATNVANAKYGSFNWWQEYVQIYQDPNAIRANWDRWRMSAGYDAEAEQIISGNVDYWESRTQKREIFGVVPISRKDYDALGEISADVAKVGMAAAAVYAGGIATGVIGTGEAVAAGTAAAETAAVSGGAAASVSTGAAATAAGATTAGGFWGGITAAGVNSTLGLVNTATNLLRRVGINIGGSSTESRPSAASGGTGVGNSLYPYYLEGTGPSIGGGFGFGGADQAPSETITDYIRAATGGGVWLIVAAVLLIGGYFLLKRR